MHFWYVLTYYIWIWLIAWKPRVHTTQGGLWKYQTLPLNRQGPHQQVVWGNRLVLELPCLTPCFDCYGRRKNLEFCLLSVIGFGKKIRSNQSLPKSKLGFYWASVPYNIICITLKAAYLLKKDNCAQKLQIYLISWFLSEFFHVSVPILIVWSWVCLKSLWM